MTASVVMAQQRSQQPTQKSELEPTHWGLVYENPKTRSINILSDVSYWVTNSNRFGLDIYQPFDGPNKGLRPVIVFINGVGDTGDNKLKSWAIYRSWGRFVAANGFVGVTMDADRANVSGSIQRVFEFLTSDGTKYGIDPSQIGVYASSANVEPASAYLYGALRANSIKSAALFYGRPPESKIESKLPTLFAIAESDAKTTAPQLTSLWGQIIETDLPWCFI